MKENMSKEMLGTLRILEEDKGIKKKISSTLDGRVASFHIADIWSVEQHVANEKQVTLQFYTVREVGDEVFDSRLKSAKRCSCY